MLLQVAPWPELDTKPACCALHWHFIEEGMRSVSHIPMSKSRLLISIGDGAEAMLTYSFREGGHLSVLYCHVSSPRLVYQYGARDQLARILPGRASTASGQSTSDLNRQGNKTLWILASTSPQSRASGAWEASVRSWACEAVQSV